MLEAAKLGKLRTKGLARVENQVAFVDHNPIEPA
jgi:hypothetical protein